MCGRRIRRSPSSYYLEGRGGLVSESIIGISGATVWLLKRLRSVRTKSPCPSKYQTDTHKRANQNFFEMMVLIFFIATIVVLQTVVMRVEITVRVVCNNSTNDNE